MATITYPDGKESHDFNLSDYLALSDYTVVYFYPKDDTSGCTLEAQGFSQSYDEFLSSSCAVVGVNQNTHTSHVKFCKKHNLTIPLISDTELEIHNDPRFITRIEKTMYGKKYMGTERATFLLNKQGDVIRERRKVSIPKHVQEVLGYVQSL